MRKTKQVLTALLLICFMSGAAGCGADWQTFLHVTQKAEAPLIRVQIHFTDQEDAVCYVKSLSLEKEAEVYTGGPSANKMYDRDGNVVGSYNYQHVIYMTILPAEGSGE